MNKKLLISALLFIPGFLAACGKTEEPEKEESKKAKDLIKDVRINLDFEEDEDTFVDATHLQVKLPPQEGDIKLATEIKVDKEKKNRVVSGCTYSIVGTYDNAVVSLKKNVLHLKDAANITLKTSFTFKDTKETVSKQFTVEFALPDTYKVTLTRATLGTLTNYGHDFTGGNGFADSVSDNESLCEMSGDGSYGYTTYGKIQSFSKVEFEFKRLGTFSSVQIWGTRYQDRDTYIEKTGHDIRSGSISYEEVNEENKLIIDFSEKADLFVEAPYCFQCWFWNSHSLSEDSALLKSITLEYLPFVEAE